MIHLPNIPAAARLEAAALRTELSQELQDLLHDRPMWIEDGTVVIWFEDEEQRVNQCSDIWVLCVRELPAAGFRHVNMKCWQSDWVVPIFPCVSR